MSAGPNAGNVLDATQVWINVGDQEIQERFFEGFDTTDNGGATINNGPNGPLGTTTTNGGYQISFPRLIEKGTKVIDYRALKRNNTPFVITQYQGFIQGNDFIPQESHQFSGCTVANVNSSNSTDGKISETVTIMATERETTNAL